MIINYFRYKLKVNGSLFYMSNLIKKKQLNSYFTCNDLVDEI